MRLEYLPTNLPYNYNQYIKISQMQVNTPINTPYMDGMGMFSQRKMLGLEIVSVDLNRFRCSYSIALFDKRSVAISFGPRRLETKFLGINGLDVFLRNCHMTSNSWI